MCQFLIGMVLKQEIVKEMEGRLTVSIPYRYGT